MIFPKSPRYLQVPTRVYCNATQEVYQKIKKYSKQFGQKHGDFVFQAVVEFIEKIEKQENTKRENEEIGK